MLYCSVGNRVWYDCCSFHKVEVLMLSEDFVRRKGVVGGR